MVIAAVVLIMWAVMILDVGRRADLTKLPHSILYSIVVPHTVLIYKTFFFGNPPLAGSRAAGLFAAFTYSIYLIYCFFRILIFPVRRNDSKSRRVGILYGGHIILKFSFWMTLFQTLFYIILIFKFRSWGPLYPVYLWVIDGIWTLAVILTFYYVGILKILLTSRRAGIVKRLFIIINIWIPVLNLFLIHHLYRIAYDEYDHQCNMVELEEARAEKYVCQTKYPLLLVHGVGFRDFKYFNYWGRIPKYLIKNGAAVYYGHQEAWGTIEDNAAIIKQKIYEILEETGSEKVNIIAHSKGGLDSRYLISSLGMADQVASLTTISTPHYGSELLDVLMKLPDPVYRRVTKLIDKYFSKIGDKNPDAYTASRQLSPVFAARFNQEVQDAPGVYYQSYATIMKHCYSNAILCIPYMILRMIKGPNDGLVHVDSAKWGEFKEVIVNRKWKGISHGDIIDLQREDYRDFNVMEKYIEIVSSLKEQGY